MSVNFNLNGKSVTAQAEPDTPLLWVVRDELGLTGTKFGCGMALCGACTVHLNGAPVRSCQTPLSAVKGQKVSTIESLSRDNSHPLHLVVPAIANAVYALTGKRVRQLPMTAEAIRTA